MKTLKKIVAIVCVALSISIALPSTLTYSVTTVDAHSGRTDSHGGHKDNKNKSGLGSYHYHCGGHPAHLHENGICPYDDSSDATPSSETTDSKVDSYTAKYQSASIEYLNRMENGQFSQEIIDQMPNYENLTTSLLSQEELEDYTQLQNEQDIDDMSKLIFIRIYDYILSQQ